MVSLFNALNITANALGVNESAISVVSHNVANMNTEGYSKQKVNFNKPWLESEEDLAEYMALWQGELEKLRKDLQEKLKSGKRIQL